MSTNLIEFASSEMTLNFGAIPPLSSVTLNFAEGVPLTKMTLNFALPSEPSPRAEVPMHTGPIWEESCELPPLAEPSSKKAELPPLAEPSPKTREIPLSEFSLPSSQWIRMIELAEGSDLADPLDPIQGVILAPVAKAAPLTSEAISGAKRLNCSRSGLTAIPSSPDLLILECKQNALTELPRELPNLTELDCSDNQLSVLEAYPKLRALRCAGNKLRSLPNYPELAILYCQNNQIEELPYYPNLRSINVTGNPIARRMKDPTDVSEYYRNHWAHYEKRFT